MSGARGKNKNTFNQGLNADMHPLDTPNTVMTDNSNVTLITAEGDEFILQNMKGNELKTALTPGFKPVAVKVFNNVSYIISQNIDDPTIGEVGTFPSPDWAELNKQEQVLKDKLILADTPTSEGLTELIEVPTSITQSLTQTRLFTGVFKDGSEITGFPYLEAEVCAWRVTYNNSAEVTTTWNPLDGSTSWLNYMKGFSSFNVTQDTIEYLKPHALDDYACDGHNAVWVEYPTGINNSQIEDTNVVKYTIGDVESYIVRYCEIDFTGTGVEGIISASDVSGSGAIKNAADINGTTIDATTGVVLVEARATFWPPYFEVILSNTITPILPVIAGGSYSPEYTQFSYEFDMAATGLTSSQLDEGNFTVYHKTGYANPLDVLHYMKYKIVSTDSIQPDDWVAITIPMGSEVPIMIQNLTDTTTFTLILEYTGVELTGQIDAFEFYITYKSDNGEILVPMLDVYAPLHNFFDYDGDYYDPLALPTPPTVPPTEAELDTEGYYVAPLRTASFNFDGITFVDIELQPSYDRSVNIFFTDGKNKPRVINSRFIVKEGNKQATIANRQGARDTNIYSDERWGTTDMILTPDTIAEIDFGGLEAGGNMLPGGYRFYFTYANSDLQTTDVFAESRLVQIHKGNGNTVSGGAPGEPTDKTAIFTLSNLDTKFLYVKVYYARDMGEFTSGVFALSEVFNLYPIPTGGEMEIRVTGFELTKPLDSSFLNTQFSDVSTVDTLTAIQGSLAIANIEISIEDVDYLRDRCAGIQIKEDTTYMGEMDAEYASKTLQQKRAPYMDAHNTYHRLGYWTGETYEFGIVFKMTSTNILSPVIPIRGLDNFDGTATYSLDSNVIPGTGFNDSDDNRENTNGVYRFNEKKVIMDGDGAYPDSPNITYASLDLSALINDSYLKEITSGFFIVRKKRSKDCQYEGYLSHATAIELPEPTVGQPTLMMTCQRGGLGSAEDFNNTVGTNPGDYICAASASLPTTEETYRRDTPAKYLPTPGNLMNSVFPADDSTTAKPKYWRFVDFTNKPLQNDVISHATFYTPDIVTRPTDVASFFGGTGRGIRYSKNKTFINKGDDAGISTQNPSLFTSSFKEAGVYGADNNAGKLSTEVMTDYTLKDLRWSYVTAGQDTITPETFTGIIRQIQSRMWASANTGDPWDNDYGYVAGSNATDEVDGNDADPGKADRGRIIHKFDDFVGMQILGGESGDLKDRLDHNTTVSGGIIYNEPSWGYTNNNLLDLSNWTDKLDNNGVVMGVLARAYPSASGPLDRGTQWQAKYQSTTATGYFAISDRYSWDRAEAELTAGEIKVYDGDCYIGELYKRINYKLGIETDPAATDPNLYEAESAGLEDAGMVFGMVLSSSDNFALRSEEYKSASEKLIYGTDRRFFPLYPLADIIVLKQLDSKLHYNGFELEVAALPYSRQSVELPAIVDSFPYRVMISAPANLSSFSNGYRDFSGLNFRDYDSAFGQIIKIIALQGQLYVIWEFGIGAIYTSEKTMVTDADGGVYVDQASRLHPQAKIISNKYGSTDPYSIVVSADALYGIDWTNNKVWQVRGGQFSLISDFKIERILTIYKEYFNNNNVIHKFYSGYDSYKRNIFFNYGGVNLGDNIPVGSIYFNETMNIWTSKLTFYPYFIFNLRENWYSFDFSEDNDTIAGQIWEHDSEDVAFCNFYGTQHPFEYEFILVDNPSIQKILNNLKVISTEEYPLYATYTIIDKHDYETNHIKETSFVDRLVKRFKNITANMSPVIATSPYLLFTEDPGLLAGEHIVVGEGTKYEVQDVLFYLDEYYVYITYADPYTGQYINHVSQAYTGEESVEINNGIIKENILYKEDHFYIVVGNKFILATESGLVGSVPDALDPIPDKTPVEATMQVGKKTFNSLYPSTFSGIDPRKLLTGGGLLNMGAHFSSDGPVILEDPVPSVSGLTPGTPDKIVGQIQLGAPRDKYIRIKLRYKGDKQVFIQAVETMFTYSFS